MKPRSSFRPSDLRSEQGLTLIELLVVVALIGVLAILGQVALGKARSMSVSVRCVQNLRMVGGAFQAFASDHRQEVYLYTEQVGSVTQWLRYLIGMTDGAHGRGSKGSIYLDNPSAAVCPGFAPRQFVGKAVDIVGYTYGNTSRDEKDPAASPIPGCKSFSRLIRLTKMESPSTYWLVADSYSNVLNRQFYAIGENNPERGLHFRHGGRANALFADGHVAGLTLKEFSELSLYSRSTGFDGNNQFISLSGR